MAFLIVLIAATELKIGSICDLILDTITLLGLLIFCWSIGNILQLVASNS